jgi:DNA-binding LacI/PurR family transcriptional regulator
MTGGLVIGIGMDGHELGEVFGLTTFDQDARGQGTLAASRILSRPNGAGAEAESAHRPVAEECPTCFVIRRSTAVPAGG